MAKLKKVAKKGDVKKLTLKKAAEKKAEKKVVAKKVSKVEKPVRRRRGKAGGEEDGDDLPPADVDEAAAAALDTESLAAEVERTESKSGEAANEDASQAPLPSVAEGESADASDADAILPSMEGRSILRETELNDVIQDVKRRSEANGGYVTYEELNQILPSNIVDAIQSDKYLKILEALGVQVIREEDVKK